jgi:Rieske Fe-S protein
MREGSGRSRRAVLAAGSTGAVAALAGCQVYRSDDPPPPVESPAGGAGTVLATTGEVEVGGGLVVSEHRVVITQPTAGDFRAFSAICTHLGCTVTSVSDGTINCPCHGSRFSIEDGSVVEPALGSSAQQPPLPAAAITVNGDEIELA